MQRIILHIDFDSFYASVEQQCNPALRNKPVGITAHNGRTAIIAASREAKWLGIKSPSRTFDAKQICKDIIFVTADFEKYYEISKKFLKICSNYSPYVEMFSLDEVFIDITQTAYLFGGVNGVITKIRKKIHREIGEYITVSVGISYNKLLAKLGSGLHKPDGITYVSKENLDHVFNKAKLSDVCGIGRRIELRLKVLGIHSLMDLKNAPVGLLIKEFGNIEGNFLHNAGFGRDGSPVIPYTQAPGVKSVGRQYCMPHNEYDWHTTLQHVYELCEEIGIKLRRLHKKAQTFGFSLRGSIYLQEIKTKRHYFDTGAEMFTMFKAYYEKVDESERQNNYIRQISVWSSDLIASEYVSTPLFVHDRRKEKLIKTIDAINDKFGDHTIRNGFLLYGAKLKTVPNGWGADRYDRIQLASV
ncbi:MAG TPA: DNA polymerase IV [Candidatus Saccharimonadales bacterium]|nr:DNA polymerase IV [Candidatus Saccharimonadales bacterium]